MNASLVLVLALASLGASSASLLSGGNCGTGFNHLNAPYEPTVSETVVTPFHRTDSVVGPCGQCIVHTKSIPAATVGQCGFTGAQGLGGTGFGLTGTGLGLAGNGLGLAGNGLGLAGVGNGLGGYGNGLAGASNGLGGYGNGLAGAGNGLGGYGFLSGAHGCGYQNALTGGFSGTSFGGFNGGIGSTFSGPLGGAFASPIIGTGLGVGNGGTGVLGTHFANAV